ncbi:hypothetical protein HDU82_008143, partial [Entophlyctis luteolus]
MFVKDFVDAINAQGSSHSDFSYAVRGLGMFAAPCKVLLSNKELNELQQILTGKLSYLASWSQDAKFAHISAFINAFTLIAKEVNNLDGSFLNAIGEGVVDFDDDKFSKNAGILSNSSREIFRRTPSRTPKIVYIRPIKDLLIISCVKDDENFDANVLVIEAREPLWKVYLTFWGTLFSADANLPSSDDIREFHEALYDGMMAAILEFPDNLNFSVREANSEANQNEEANINGAVNEFPLDSSKIVAETPADFAIFVNFVSLCETLLPMLALNLFEKWITVAGQKFVAYSRAHPVVSGFYKLMASILVIAEKLKVFEIIADYQMDLDTSPLMSEDQSAAHHLFSEYISDTLLRMRQFKDDLLVSCLKMVLACPVQIVSVTRLCGPIVQALKLGLVYTPLAIVSLDALEHWISSRSAIDQKDLKNVFALVLPAFNDYLMLELEDDATQQQESSRSSKRVTKRGGKERTKHLKIHGFDNQEMDVETISNLRKVQIRIVKFLGKIGQDNRLLFDTSANESMLVWDPERNLKFPLPFKEAIFDLSLDDMLPRIAELAEFSPDRKAKIAANELLHALTMFMIGKSQMNRPEKESRSPYHKTYIKLFPVFLRLAVDLDRVTRELFQPMVMQLIHWFTKNSKYENPETMALLQSCFDSVSSTNGPLREFGAECIAEYLKWSIKHASENELENNPINAKSLFKRLYLLCKHSSPTKRLSASVIVNRIYTIFRESNALIDVFTFEILHHLLFSLKLSEADSSSLGTHRLAKTAIDNMSKIVFVKSDIFLKKSIYRRQIPQLATADLQSLIQWLFEEVGSKELEYSYKCIELFDKFVSKTTGVSEWIRSQLAKNANYLFNLFDLKSIDFSTPSEKLVTWRRQFRSALIVYRYLTDRCAISPSAIFGSLASGLAKSINSFCRNLDSNLNDEHAFIILKIFELLHSALLKISGNSDVLDPIFHSTEIFGVLAKFVFEPALLGFDLGKQEAKEEISVRIVEFLGVFKKSLGKEIRTKMFAELAQFLLDSEHDLRKINEDSHFVTAKAQQMQSVTLKSYFERVLENALSLSHGPNLLRKRLAEEMIMECLNSAEMGCWCFQQLLKACYADRKILQNLSSVINLAIVKNWATLKEELPPAGEPSFAALMMDNFFRWLTNWKIKHQHEFEAFLAKLISNSDLCKATVSVYRRNGDDPLLKFWRNILFQSSSAAKDGLTELFWEDFFIVFSSKSSLGTLNELFDFLPYVICPSKTLKIEDCLRSIISEKFPLASKNVEEYSEQFGDYRLAMSRLIFSMGQAANSILLEKCLIIHLCRDPKHPFNSQFIESLSKKVSNISAKLFLELAEEGFRLSIETRIAPENRINVARTLLIPVLQFGQLQHVTDFYAAKVQEIMAVLASSASENDSEIKDTFVNKSVCFLLMELAYKRIPSQHLHSSSGKILCAFVAPKSGEKELTVSLIKAGVDFKKKQRSDDVSISPFRLLANQCAFNSVAACLLSTQNTTKTDIFNSYLFVEKPLLWENIIDITVCSPQYLVSLTDMQNLIFIRSELDFPLPRLAVKDFTEHLISRNPVKYLSTQFLADSSLSQMKSLFKRDSGVSPLKPSTVSSSFDPSAPGPQYLSTFAYGSEQTNFEELDLDLINENICMKAFLSVILRLPSARDDPEMPSWMKSLFSKIEKPETHINIRLFILVAAYSEINIESKSTIRNNLQIVRVLVENWKHLGVAPTDVIFDHLNAKWDGSSKAGKYQNLTGVYIFQVFVANNICPYDPRSLSDRIFSENDFYNLMGTMLAEAKSKELYSPLAECFGELLKFLGKSSSGSLWAATVNEICRKRSTSDKKAFVTIVNRISVNYPLILKAQYKMLLSLFHSLDLEQKAKALEAILCWADEIPDLFTEILGLDVDSILFSGDEELQTYFLSIMAVLAPSLTPSQVEMFHTKTVELFVEHPSDRCRAAFFAMSHKLFETNNFASFNPVLKNSIRFSLLKGLTDSDEGIKSSLLEFFNSKVFSSNTIFERFIEILRTWYIPDIEDSFLKCTMHFLMDACKLTPMFEQKVYDRGLPEARFNDRDIVVDLSWERSSSMLPLFAATQQDRALSMPDVGSVLRMTQELVWTPTQDISAKDARSRFSLSVSEFEDFNKSSPRPLADRSTRGPLRRNYAAKRETSSFAYETERKKVESRNVEKFKKLATQRNVKIYRKYREGELPDIEISYRDIIEPLQSLAIRDNDVARQLLTLIIVKMGSHSAELKPEVVAEGIHFVFKSSTMMTPSVVGCLLDIMLQNTDAIQFSDPALISNVASRSSNFELGSLVVEHGIQNGLFGKESKRMKSLTRNLKRSPEEWVNLAKLFKDLKNYEVYESIYQSHISSSNITKEAINAEMLGNYEVAKQKYIEGLNGENLEINDCEPTLWTVRRLECMNKLGEWSLLASCVVEDLEEQVEAVWDDAKRDPYLSLFLRSHLKLFDGRITSDDKHKSIDPPGGKTDDPAAGMLAILCVMRLNPPQIFELDEFLSFAKDLKSQAFDDINTGKLFREWQSRYPSSVDSISIWDDVIIGRKRMIEMAIDFIDTESKFSPEFANEFKTLCSSNDLLYSRKMAKAAASQKLFDVADRWLETATPEAGVFDPEFMAQYYKLQLMKCEHEREFFKRFEIVSNLARHMDYYKKSIRNTSNLMQMKFMLLEIRLLSQLGSSSESLKANDSFFESVASSKAITKFANGKKLESKQDLYTFFFGRSKTNMQLLHSFDLPPAPFQKGLLELGVFVDKCLKTIESDASLNLPVDLQREPAKIVLYSVLKAMNIGSIKAIEFFPRLLQLLMQHPHLNEEFQKHSLECPTWMFMKWLPQLTALLDKPSGIAVLPVIMRIANQYPNALRFPFTISCEQYTFSSFGSENEKMVEKIRRIIQSDAYDRLALELRRLEDPVHIYKDLCDRVESLLSSSLPNKRSALKQAFEDFKLICFDTRRAGDIVRKFAEKHSSKISGIFGGGEKLDDKKLKELQSYREKFGTEAESKPGKNLVKSFSTWLDQYQIGNFDDSELLEVPGQYTGLREPYPADHVKIANFDPNVLVMSSMRRPKKIVMIGTDEKEYPWLVKGGEDLRLDQRIEQMFGVMNELISRNPFCSRNRVNIVTYKVIPMSTSLGLIEWVDGTKPLKACFADNPAFDKKFNEAMSLFGEFIQKHGKSGQSFVA